MCAPISRARRQQKIHTAVFEALEDRRLLSVGELDSLFNGSGVVSADPTEGYDAAYAVTVAAGGRIVAAGDAGGDFGLVRYYQDGSVDTSFGADGVVTTDFDSSYDWAHSVVI